MRAERDAVETDWILAPVARIVVGVPILAEHRFRVLRTIRCAQVQDRVSSSLAEANAVEDRGRGIAQASHAVTQLSVERILLRRKHCDESVVRSICDSRFGRNLPADARQTGVAGVAAVGSNECVEYRDVHDRYCARRAAGPDLFAEDTIFACCDRCVIDSARVDRDLVPVNHPAAQIAAGRRIAEDRCRSVADRLVRDAERVAEGRRSLGEGNVRSKACADREQRSPDHCAHRCIPN
jgi:hypothetical protein